MIALAYAGLVIVIVVLVTGTLAAALAADRCVQWAATRLMPVFREWRRTR